ncbi:MAG TPA: DUF4395 domain-containing protein [Streptosporangiaceae bacterium]
MEIDPRGPRFGAVITTVVLAVVLVTGSAWLLGVQLAVFATGALAGLRYAPYGVVFRAFIRPRLGPPGHTEAEAPPRFSQAVGMVFALGGVLGYALGATAVGIVFTAFALVAAFLNAAFDFCLGCQAYLLIQRNLKVRPSA